ncbi:MAG: hypothetical protein J6X60_08590 [Ruminiclostridium sp.]|nr:hypothetical protein [Ruminiclostridium sp.]
MRHTIIRFLCGIIFLISAAAMAARGEFVSAAFGVLTAVFFLLSGMKLIRKDRKG